MEEKDLRQSFEEKLESWRNFSSYDKRDFLIGSLMLLLLVSVSLNVASFTEKPEEWISPEKAGSLTAETVNNKILGPSPNNVTATLVNITSAESEGLENFYRVRLNTTNPAGSQITSVYTKKDGSLVFLQFPRQLGDDFQKGRYH